MSKPLRVLIVADSEGDTPAVLHELQQGGYDPTMERVDTFVTLDAALARHPWDIIISDYPMPNCSVSVVLALLQQRGLDPPLIIVSGMIQEDLVALTMRVGVHDYIRKDYLARLTPAVTRELRAVETRREHRRVTALAQRLNTVLDCSSNEIYLLDPTTLAFIQVNQTAQRNLGYAAETLAQMTLPDLQPELNTEEVARLIEPLRAGAQDQLRMESVHRRQDGSTYPVEIDWHVLRSETPPVMVAIVNDLTTRKQAVSALRTIRDTERERIARMLHAGAFQDLIATEQKLLATRARISEAELADELGQPLSILRRAMRALRSAIYNLHPDEGSGAVKITPISQTDSRWAAQSDNNTGSS